MPRRILAALFLIYGSFAVAQSDSNSVTVTASRTISSQPDQAVFYVTVTARSTTTLQDILNAVQPAGLTLANFSSVVTAASALNNPQLLWTFTLDAPLANTKATIATLTNLQSAVAKANPNLTISFSVQGTQISPQAAQSQTCPLAGLMSDATAKAQALAAAANRFVSGIMALATATNTCSVTVRFSLVGS